MIRQFSRRQSLIFLAGGVLFVLLLDALINDQDGGGYSHHALSQMQAAFVPSHPCEPYEANGHLHINVTDPHSNRWIPFDNNGDCHAPALVAGLLRVAWKDQPEDQLPEASPIIKLIGSSFIHEPLDPMGLPWDDMKWLRGRTVLHVGDSIARQKIYDFCQMVKGELATPVEPTSEYYPWEGPDIVKVGDKKDLQPRGPGSGYFLPDADPKVEKREEHSHEKRQSSPTEHGPFYCYIPELDFMYATMFTFGMDEYGYFSERERYVVGPYIYEQRLEYVAKPLMDRIQEKLGRAGRKVDMVYLMSALWDNARWMREDITVKIDPHTFISNERINWYSDRIVSSLRKTMELFPHTPVRWVTNHYPINHEGSHWFFADLDKLGKRPTHVLPRLWRMSHAGQSAVAALQRASGRRADVKVVPWGERVLGTDKFQYDDLHPTLFPSNYVWADMMLWELKRSLM